MTAQFTGLVHCQTTVFEDNVSLLQGVTLSGIGKESGDRHTKVRKGTMIGAGGKVLGSIEVEKNARIAAGSVVLQQLLAETLEHVFINYFDYAV